MSRKPQQTSLQSHIDQVVARAAADISATIRRSIAEEVRRVVGAQSAAAAAPAPRAGKPGRPAKVAKAPVAKVAVAKVAVAKAPVAKVAVAKAAKASRPAKKKRSWPMCGTKGCANKFFAPSGTARLCYEHYVAAGGKHPGKK